MTKNEQAFYNKKVGFICGQIMVAYTELQYICGQIAELHICDEADEPTLLSLLSIEFQRSFFECSKVTSLHDVVIITIEKFIDDSNDCNTVQSLTDVWSTLENYSDDLLSEYNL